MAQRSRSKRPRTPARGVELVSVREAAAIYHDSDDTIRRRVVEGRLTGYKLGSRLLRVDLGEVAKLFEAIPTAGDHEATG
jgi:hypothetical protein